MTPARVLVVTGQDYPGHVWKETAPALAAELRRDPRLQVTVVEDPAFMADPKLQDYDCVVLHFMNWECPSPGPAARENLRALIAGGKGLVLVHFACGAWQDWPGFAELAGRVYDPKLPPHDPRGPFRVDITPVKHPVTEGMEGFETDDELYTCLAGDRPIEVLATARSKVTGKDEAMAFVLNCGKGRVFHSPLGHDVKALTQPGVAALFRRGTAWAAGLPPAVP
jgi:type 1 glutamine amidotransferase